MNKEIETKVAEQAPARRKLLKALTAGGAAAAVAPSDWTAPALKSVVLPAHAQTTGVGGNCGLQAWLYNSNGGSTCFSMSANVKADNSTCAGPGQVTVYNSSGTALATCSNTLHGAPIASFSCSLNGETAIAAENELVTFVAEFDSGCSCSFITRSQ